MPDGATSTDLATLIAQRYRTIPLSDLTPYARNSKVHSPEQVAALEASLLEFGWTRPVAQADGTILAGHGVVMAAHNLAEAGKCPRWWPDAWAAPIVDLSHLSEEQRRAYVIADNRLAEKGVRWDEDLLAMELGELQDGGFDLNIIGYDDTDLSRILGEGPLGGGGEDEPGEGEEGPAGTSSGSTEGGAGSLAARFGVPPFTVLNAREGWWQNRKRAWLALGIRSEVGRGENLLRMSDTMLEPDPEKRAALEAARARAEADPRITRDTNVATPWMQRGPKPARLTWVAGERDPADMDETSQKIAAASSSGTSIFDPVLCEMAYRWWCPKGGLVLDPFAGGSVRGIVAAKLGREYIGVDLRPEQVYANQEQAAQICSEGTAPAWVQGDSLTTIPTLDTEADFVFSCPPYGDLERYSDLPDDLSTMDHPAFVEAYRAIIAAAVTKLKNDRFACFVVGDFRDRQGFYRNFVSATIQAFEDAGARLYNEAILVTAVGSLALRAGRQFAVSRKLGKAHQNILVFCKGDPMRAAAAVGEVEFGELPAEALDEEAAAELAAEDGQDTAGVAEEGEEGEPGAVDAPEDPAGDKDDLSRYGEPL